MNGRMLFDPIGYPSRDVAPAAPSSEQRSSCPSFSSLHGLKMQDSKTRGQEEPRSFATLSGRIFLRRR
jgi:hypothetical protein